MGEREHQLREWARGLRVTGALDDAAILIDAADELRALRTRAEAAEAKVERLRAETIKRVVEDRDAATARAEGAERERDELLSGRERVTEFDLHQRGGEWLGAVRSWVQWHCRNGSDVTWGSTDALERTFTVRDVEEIGAIAAAKAMRPQPNEARLAEAMKARWAAERAVERERERADGAAQRLDITRRAALEEAAGDIDAELDLWPSSVDARLALTDAQKSIRARALAQPVGDEKVEEVRRGDS